MLKKLELTLLLTACFMLSTFAQTAQEPVQVVEIQKEPKAKHIYSWQPFVVGGIAIGQPTSFRLQAGMVKRVGFYVAVTTNFHPEWQPDGDYGENPEEYSWTGKKRYSRWILQAGPVVRIKNFMMYCGAGVGKCVLLRETVDGLWMWSHHQSHFDDWTVEVDLGFMYRIKRFVVSAGYSSGYTMTRWYSTGNVGLGVMF